MSLKHYGFAHPLLPFLLVPVAPLVWHPLTWVAILAAYLGVVLLGGTSARHRALLRVRRWAAERGIANVERAPRGGFVSWGWTVWTFAEINRYRGVDRSGAARHIWASHLAPAFGLFVYTRCEVCA